jgi:hypothetical protein
MATELGTTFYRFFSLDSSPQCALCDYMEREIEREREREREREA